jgi:hypothetical protein
MSVGQEPASDNLGLRWGNGGLAEHWGNSWHARFRRFREVLGKTSHGIRIAIGVRKKYVPSKTGYSRSKVHYGPNSGHFWLTSWPRPHLLTFWPPAVTPSRSYVLLLVVTVLSYACVFLHTMTIVRNLYGVPLSVRRHHAL